MKKLGKFYAAIISLVRPAKGTRHHAIQKKLSREEQNQQFESLWSPAKAVPTEQVS